MRVTRQQAVVERLREMVLHGTYRGGDRLQEVHLSDLLQVSRTPIREALITLAEEGLVEYRPNRGYIVRNFTLDMIMDAYTVREALEGLACRLLAETGASEETKERLEECVAEGDRILSVDRLTDKARVPWGKVNSQFHSLIVQSTGNRALVDALAKATAVPMTSNRVIHWFDEGDREGLFQLRTVHAQHHAIFRYICSGQGYHAETAMRGHIAFAANHVRTKYASVAESPERSDLAAE